MIESALNALADASIKLEATYSKVVSALPALEGSAGSLLGISLDDPVPEAFGSINDCNARIKAILGIVSSISKMKPSDFSLVPKTLVSNLPKRINDIEGHLSAMLTRIEEVRNDGGLRDVTDGFVIHSVGQNAHPSVDLREFYKNADNQIDQALKGTHDILSIIDHQSFDPFAGALAGIRGLEEELQTDRTTLARLRKDAITKSSQINKRKEVVDELFNSIKAKRDETISVLDGLMIDTESSATNVEKSKEKITQLLENVSDVEQQASALKGKVDALNPSIEEFQKNLNERDQTFNSGKQEFENLRSAMIVASEENSKYIQQSKEALSWNTANGLASSFAQSAKELKLPIMLSRLGFCFSIVLLFLSAGVAFNGVPYLADFIKVPAFPSFSGELGGSLSEGGIAATVSAGADTVTSGLIGAFAIFTIKVAVILPAILLVGFTSRLHRALFLQHQLYTYKKTVASALPGFKDHADAHKEAMAAAAFARLLFNPQEDSSRDLIRESGGQGFLSKWLERVIAKSFKTAMASDDKKLD